jgi:ketosteroid isomerase-like protein
MRTRLTMLLLTCAGLFPATLLAQDVKPAKEKPEDPVHEELRAFQKTLLEAIEKGDLERQLEHVHKDVVVTWQHGEVVRGHDALRDFYKKNVSQRKVFQGYKQQPTPTELTIMHGSDMGISYGTDVGRYKLTGMDFDLKNYWTLTLVKEGAQWKIASYHVSANVLDNPVLNTAKNWLYAVGGIALVVGLLLGLFIGRRRSRAPA